jgi:hypothetical protein
MIYYIKKSYLQILLFQSLTGFQMRHIIPIHREECIAPSCIRFLTANDYTKVDLRPWFWPRVAVCFKDQRRPFLSMARRGNTRKLPDVVCLPDIILDSFPPDGKDHLWRNIWIFKQCDVQVFKYQVKFCSFIYLFCWYLHIPSSQ